MAKAHENCIPISMSIYRKFLSLMNTFAGTSSMSDGGGAGGVMGGDSGRGWGGGAGWASSKVNFLFWPALN